MVLCLKCMILWHSGFVIDDCRIVWVIPVPGHLSIIYYHYCLHQLTVEILFVMELHLLCCANFVIFFLLYPRLSNTYSRMNLPCVEFQFQCWMSVFTSVTSGHLQTTCWSVCCYYWLLVSKASTTRFSQGCMNSVIRIAVNARDCPLMHATTYCNSESGLQLGSPTVSYCTL